MLKSFYTLFVLSFLFFSCETDDVVIPGGEDGPTVSLSSNQVNISENSGVATITATLSASHSQDVVVNLSFAGTASNTDYAESASNITVPAGSISAGITVTAVQDDLEEGNESVVITIGTVQNGSANGFQQITITIEDDDVAQIAQIILNEILYDPSNSGLAGDSNNDGVYAQADDEFIELVNLSSLELDMSGYKIFDTSGFSSNTPRHLIPSNTIVPAGGALVIFGGGNPTGSFGGAIVQTSSTGDLNFQNDGDILYLVDTEGNTILSFDIEPLSNNPNESYTRNPDLTGDFVQHASAESGVLFSPGTKIDGSPF